MASGLEAILSVTGAERREVLLPPNLMSITEMMALPTGIVPLAAAYEGWR